MSFTLNALLVPTFNSRIIGDLIRSHKNSFNGSLHSRVGITLINNEVYSGNSQIQKHWTKIALFKPHIWKYIFLCLICLPLTVCIMVVSLLGTRLKMF